MPDNDTAPTSATQDTRSDAQPKTLTTAERAQDSTQTGATTTPTVMVDELVPYPRARHRCFRAGACHLTVDGDTAEHYQALHDFAARIGMKRAWFQAHRLAPHYDLTRSRRDRALELGAVFVPAREQAEARIARRKIRGEG